MDSSTGKEGEITKDTAVVASNNAVPSRVFDVVYYGADGSPSGAQKRKFVSSYYGYKFEIA